MLISTLKAPEIVRICIAFPKNEKSNPKDMRYPEKLNLHCNSIWPGEAKEVYPWDKHTQVSQHSTLEGLKLHLWPDLYRHVQKWHFTVTLSKSQQKASKISA